MRLRSNDLGPGSDKTDTRATSRALLSRLSTKLAPNIIYIGNNGSEEQPASAPDRERSHMCAHFAKGGSSESCLPLATVAVASTFQTTIARS